MAFENAKNREAQKNKAQLVLNSLRENGDKAFYNTEIAARLEESGVTICDVGVNLRRYEKKGKSSFRATETHSKKGSSHQDTS